MLDLCALGTLNHLYRDFKKRKREQFRRIEGRGAPNINGRGDSQAEGGQKIHMARDDIMMQRFWSRMRNRRRM